MLPNLILVSIGSLYLIYAVKTVRKFIFDFFGPRQSGPVGQKTLFMGVFCQFLIFFSKMKIWIFMLTNLILVSIV